VTLTAGNIQFFTDRILAAANRNITTDYAAPALDVPTFRRKFGLLVGQAAGDLGRSTRLEHRLRPGGTSISAGIVTGSFALVASALDYWADIQQTGVTVDAYLTQPVGARTLNFGPHTLKNLSAYNNPDGINGILAWTSVPITDANDALSEGEPLTMFRSSEYRDYARIDIGNAIAAIEGQIAIQYLLDRGTFDVIDTNDNALITAPELQTFVDNAATIGLPEAGAMARLLGGTARTPGTSAFFNTGADQPDVLQRRFNFFDFASDGQLNGMITIDQLKLLSHNLLPLPDQYTIVDRQRASANGFLLDPEADRNFKELQHLKPSYQFVPKSVVARYHNISPGIFGVNRGSVPLRSSPFYAAYDAGNRRPSPPGSCEGHRDDGWRQDSEPGRLRSGNTQDGRHQGTDRRFGRDARTRRPQTDNPGGVSGLRRSGDQGPDSEAGIERRGAHDGRGPGRRTTTETALPESTPLARDVGGASAGPTEDKKVETRPRQARSTRPRSPNPVGRTQVRIALRRARVNQAADVVSGRIEGFLNGQATVDKLINTSSGEVERRSGFLHGDADPASAFRMRREIPLLFASATGRPCSRRDAPAGSRSSHRGSNRSPTGSRAVPAFRVGCPMARRRTADAADDLPKVTLAEAMESAANRQPGGDLAGRDGRMEGHAAASPRKHEGHGPRESASRARVWRDVARVRELRTGLQREVERLGDQSPEPPAERVGPAVDLGEAAQAGLQGQIAIVDGDDHLVDGGQGLDLSGLLILLRRDLAAGEVRQLGGISSRFFGATSATWLRRVTSESP
jgi:hypothetical protein